MSLVPYNMLVIGEKISFYNNIQTQVHEKNTII